MPEIERGGNRPLGPSSGEVSGSLGGSGMLQSVPAQVVSQVQVASLLHTCTDEMMNNIVGALNKGADALRSCLGDLPSMGIYLYFC